MVNSVSKRSGREPSLLRRWGLLERITMLPVGCGRNDSTQLHAAPPLKLVPAQQVLFNSPLQQATQCEERI